MSRKQAEYAIHELAKKANVSVRTVRFYINEGLLPPPQTRGRYTVYTEEYLDRLELIRRLKDAFLPLKEIRTTLNSLSWEEVRTTLADLRKKEADRRRSRTMLMPNGERKVGDERSSALEYIDQLLSSTPVNRPLPPDPIYKEKARLNQMQVEPDLQSWQRVNLAAGVELHIRQPLHPEDQPKVEAIIRLAKKLFSS